MSDHNQLLGYIDEYRERATEAGIQARQFEASGQTVQAATQKAIAETLTGVVSDLEAFEED